MFKVIHIFSHIYDAKWERKATSVLSDKLKPTVCSGFSFGFSIQPNMSKITRQVQKGDILLLLVGQPFVGFVKAFIIIDKLL